MKREDIDKDFVEIELSFLQRVILIHIPKRMTTKIHRDINMIKIIIIKSIEILPKSPNKIPALQV